MSDINPHIKNGSAAEGSKEWLNERFSALFSIPLLLWFIFSLCSSCHTSIESFLLQPFNAILMVMFIGFFLDYTTLAMKVVVEDYVHCECMKLALIWGMKFLALLAFVSATYSIIYITI